jgi:endonuclease/exonuclease/phosphatase family metal-dependent hydrolase
MALRARTGGMLVYTAHLESGGNDTLRRKQLDEMVRDQQRQARPDERVVLAGDFNNPPVARSSMFGAIRYLHYRRRCTRSAPRCVSCRMTCILHR